MNQQDIKTLLAHGERITLECKAAQGGVPTSLWETYSAFANTYGGVILLGIKENMKEADRSKRFTLSGVDDADKVVRDLWNILNNKEKVNVNLLHDEDVEVFDFSGKKVVAVRVPRADSLVRPIYINGNLSKGAFKRNHEGDYHCTESELRMMMRDANEAGNDNLFLEYYTMDDIDIPTLERYRVRFRTDNPDHVWNNLEHKEFLMQLGGYVINRKEKTEGLTMAGLLMFGKGLPVRERFDNLRMDYIDKTNLVGEERYSDRLTYDGTWENNLFNFMQIVLPRLTRDLPRPFRMEGMVRQDDTQQHKAVREAFTNAIIHGDLMLNGLLRVEKYDDRFVFTNPGLLKLPVEQIYRGGESKARNQRMQNMLRMIGYGENLGSGFPLILNAWKERQWPQPEVIEQPELMQVKLVLPIVRSEDAPVNITSDNKDFPEDAHKGQDVRYDVRYGDSYEFPANFTKNQTERLYKIISLMQSNPHIMANEMAESLSVNYRTISRDVKALRDLGIVSRKGRKKDGIWLINSNPQADT